MTDQTIIIKEMEIIKNALRHYSNGALIEDIEKHVHLNLSRRTLQRRLLTLQKTGYISAKGKTQSTRYFLNMVQGETQKKVFSSEYKTIPLSKNGENLLYLIKRPLQHRTPVGYNIDFLNHYQPNITSYLSFEEKEKLSTMGKINIPNQMAGTYNKEILSRLLIDLSWNSSRLEGNTYSLLDTQRLIRVLRPNRRNVW